MVAITGLEPAKLASSMQYVYQLRHIAMKW